MSVTDADQVVPAELITENFVLLPITTDVVELDFEAVTSSRDALRLWSQSDWPEDALTVADNLRDLEAMVQRREKRAAFDYTVLDPSRTRCLGCVYIFPPDVSFLRKAEVTPLSERAFTDLDAIVYFWIRSSLAATDIEDRLVSELRTWFTDVWKLERVAFDVSEVFRHQINVCERAGLVPKFRLRDPAKSGGDIIFM